MVLEDPPWCQLEQNQKANKRSTDPQGRQLGIAFGSTVTARRCCDEIQFRQKHEFHFVESQFHRRF